MINRSSYMDDDRDYIPTPESHFMGYKCPHFQCDTIMVDHDYCRAVRIRLDASGDKFIPTYTQLIDMVKWNFDQFLKKSPTALSVR